MYIWGKLFLTGYFDPFVSTSQNYLKEVHDILLI